MAPAPSLHVVRLDDQPARELRYLNAARGDDQPGHAAVRALVERRVALTVCGHVHWPRALATTERGQILNVDARVVVLARAR